MCMCRARCHSGTLSSSYFQYIFPHKGFISLERLHRIDVVDWDQMWSTNSVLFGGGLGTSKKSFSRFTTTLLSDQRNWQIIDWQCALCWQQNNMVEITRTEACLCAVSLQLNTEVVIYWCQKACHTKGFWLTSFPWWYGSGKIITLLHLHHLFCVLLAEISHRVLAS